MENLSNNEILKHIEQSLFDYGIKKNKIKIGDNFIKFTIKDKHYSVTIESVTTVIYKIDKIDGINLNSSWYEEMSHYENHRYIEDYLNLLSEDPYDYAKKVWFTLEKLGETFDSNLVETIVFEYYGL